MAPLAPLQHSAAPRRRDPLEAVLALGWQASRMGLVVGVLVGLFAHSLALAKPAFALHDMLLAVQEMRTELSDFYWTRYEIEVTEEAAPEPEEAAEPEVAPAPEAVAEPEPLQPLAPVAPTPDQPPPPDDDAPPPSADDPYDEPPPAAAAAPDVMTTDDGAVDLSGEGFTIVDKDGSKETGGGTTSGKGTSKKPVFDPRARAHGVPGGRGTATARRRPPPPPSTKDLSRRALPTNMGVLRACPFPPQADVAQVDRATVVVTVTVSAAGRALRAAAQGGPGYGFGAQAKRCAMAASYRPALSRSGKAVTAPVSLRFTFRR